MEHGFADVARPGNYRLDADHYPVTAVDVIWRQVFVREWFVAMGQNSRELYLLQEREP